MAGESLAGGRLSAMTGTSSGASGVGITRATGFFSGTAAGLPPLMARSATVAGLRAGRLLAALLDLAAPAFALALRILVPRNASPSDSLHASSRLRNGDRAALSPP